MSVATASSTALQSSVASHWPLGHGVASHWPLGHGVASHWPLGHGVVGNRTKFDKKENFSPSILFQSCSDQCCVSTC